MIGVIKGTMRQKKEVNGLPLPIASYKANMKAPIRSLQVAITAKQSGSGTPAPDNIRPIIGASESNVVRTGTNLWDEETVIFGSGLQSKNFISVIPFIRLYFVMPSDLYNGQGLTVYQYNANKTLIFTSVMNSANYGNNHALTLTSDTRYLKFNVGSTYGTTYNNDISINYPYTDTNYHAYTGNTYTIALGDTYYGGSLDVTTGVLTVTHANIASYAGESINEPWICSEAVYSEGATPPTGSQVVYPLATPITVQLTPTQVEQLLGQNNVWCDTGDVEELKYTNRQVYYGR